MKKNTSYLIIFMFMLSALALNTQIGSAALDNIEEGDTVYYKISSYSIPLEQLVPPGGEIDVSDITLDLTDSQFGVKVMRVNNDGTYDMNVFAILGKNIVIPFPDTTPTQITSIFGDSFTIPAGVGISVGQEIPGNNVVANIDMDPSNDQEGIPLYIEPSSTDDLKTFLEAEATEPGVTVTVDDGTDVFKIDVDADTPGGNFTFTAEWFKTGSDAGFFKGLSATGTVEGDGGDQVDIAIGFDFEKREHMPLPDEIKNQEMQTYLLESANFDLTFTGDFADLVPQEVVDGVDMVKGNLTSFEGEDILRMSVTEVDGLYYKASMDFNNLVESGWIDLFDDVWFNGFTGSPTAVDTSGGDPVAPDQLLTAFFLPAPARTPDWTINQANLKTVNALISILTTALTSSSASSELLNFGLTLSAFTAVTELRESGDFKYFYSDLNVNLGYDASDAQLVYRPEGFDGDETANFELASDSWTSYTSSGLFAGYGNSISATLDLANMPTDNDTLTGSVAISFDLKIRNKAFGAVPDGADASPLAGDGSILPTPGFELIPMLITLFVSTVYLRNRKNR